MASIEFTVNPGVAAREGAPLNPLANIRHAVPPAGQIKALFDQMTGEYSAIEKSRIAQSFYDLQDAGILDKMDLLCIRGRTENDCFINWAGTGRASENFAAEFVPGKGMRCTSTDNYVHLHFSPGRYQLGDACAFAWATDYPAAHPENNPRVFGRVGGDTGTGMSINASTSANSTASLNYTAGSQFLTGVPAPRTGFWGLTEIDAVVDVYFREARFPGVGQTGTYGLPSSPGNLALGKFGSSYYPWTYGAWGYGAGLTPEQMATLRTSIAGLFKHF